MALQQGALLGGRYELVERLGEGGMGAVWVASDARLGGAQVAVKVLHPNLADDKSSVERFRNEARIAARIGHPSIVRVFDFGESDDGAHYMVMERMTGESLAERLEREGSLAPREAASVTLAVLEALDAAHQKDVLHRDMKPENVFLAREGDAVVPKILDFGVSKILGDDARRTRMTRTGAILGTPAYMAPEQVMGTGVDLRADVWAVGVMLYELLTGKLPFDAPNYNAVLVRIVTSQADPLSGHLPDLDPGLAAIVERAMARRASDRYASARRMHEALSQWFEAVPSAAAPRAQRTPPSVSRSTPMAFEHSDTMPGDVTLATRRRSRALVAGALVTSLLAAAVIARNPFARVPRASTAAPASLAPRHTLRIENLPRGAHITVDGEPVMLPVQVRGDADHRVLVSVPGFRPWMQVVPRPSGDVALDYRGEPEAPAVPVAQPDAPDSGPLARPAPRRATARPAPRGASVNDLVGGTLPY